MSEKNGKCIVICAGDLTMSELHPGENDFVIAVDGGLAYCPILEVEPDLIIGDFDSVSEREAEAIATLKNQIPDRIISLPREKDDTDTIAALKEGLKRGYRDFRIYAGMGGRFDHTFANLQCLLFLKHHNACGYLVDGLGMMLVIENETVHFRKDVEGIVSLFCLGDKAEGVTIEGLKYEVSDYTVSNDFPIGISNEFVGKDASVSVQNGALACIISYLQ